MEEPKLTIQSFHQCASLISIKLGTNNYLMWRSQILHLSRSLGVLHHLEKNGEKFTGVSTGDGPIDAAFHAIEQILGHHYELDDFQVRAVTEGREAMGETIVKLRSNGKLYSGRGISTDIVGSSIRAYVNAINKIVYEEVES